MLRISRASDVRCASLTFGGTIRMHDPSRIPALLAALHNVWKRNRDLRLTELILIAASKSGHSVACPELLALDDEELLRGLRNFDSQPPPRFERELHSNDRFFGGEEIEGVVLKLNQHVRFTGGECVGEEGFVIGLDSLLPEPMYRIERRDDGREVVVPQSWLAALD